MIYGNLNTVARSKYYGLGERFSAGFDYLDKVRQSGRHTPGKAKICGEEIWANAVCLAGKSAADAKFEYHRRYADIHWCMAGQERIDWQGGLDGLEKRVDYNGDHDFGLVHGPVANSLLLRGDYFAILFPNEPHAALLGEGMITKICVKIAMD